MDQPKTSRGRILHWLDAGTSRWGERTEDFDATYVRTLVDRMRWAFGPGGPYRVDVSGWKGLPTGPVLVVSNHSGLHELLRIDIFPIHLSLPWGLGIGPVPHIPFPARLSYCIGEPILPPRHDPRGRRPSRTEVSEHDALVRHRLQQLLDRLALERGARPPQPHV